MAKKKARKFSTEFKLEAVRRMAEATSIVGLAEELGVRRKLLYQWRDRLQAEGNAGLGKTCGPATREQAAEDFATSCQRNGVAYCRVGAAPWAQATGSGFFKTSLRARQGSSIESHQRWKKKGTDRADPKPRSRSKGKD